MIKGVDTNKKLDRIIIRLLKLLVTFSIFFYGVGVGAYQWFPFQVLHNIKNSFFQDENYNLSIRNNEHRRIGLFEQFSPNVDLVFIGDSLTENGEWSDFFPGFKVANRGVESDKTSDVLERLDSIYVVDAEQALIMIGINDIYSNIAVDEIIKNYKKIVKQLLEKKIIVIIQSTIQCLPKVCGPQRVLLVNQLNKKLEQLAFELNVKYLKLSELSNQEGLDLSMTYDGVHLNSLGYQSWVKDIEDLIL